MDNKDKSSGCSGCNDCAHQGAEYEGWCYMFTDKPFDVPCAQHDMYAAERRANGKRIYEAMLKRNA